MFLILKPHILPAVQTKIHHLWLDITDVIKTLEEIGENQVTLKPCFRIIK